MKTFSFSEKGLTLDLTYCIMVSVKEGINMTNHLQLNQTVRNHGILAKIVGFHEVTGDPILRSFWNDDTKWLASAAMCEPVDINPAEVSRHKNGLVNLD